MLTFNGKLSQRITCVLLVCMLTLSLLLVSSLPPFANNEAHAAVQATYYVSTTGSGSTCSLASPCSITGARDKVRTVNSSMTGDIYVYIKATVLVML